MTNNLYSIIILMYKYFLLLSLIFISCSTLDIQRCPELSYNSINKLTSLPDGTLYTGRCEVYEGDLKKSIQQYIDGVDYGNWVFYFPNGKIETKGNHEYLIKNSAVYQKLQLQENSNEN